MSFSVVFDWKLALALGLDVALIIFAIKMDPSAARDVSIKAVEMVKESANALNGIR